MKKLMKTALLSSLVLTISLPAAAREFWIAPDVKIEVRKTVPVRKSAVTDLRQCRAEIKNLICLVDPEGDSHQARPCLPTTKNYAAPFEAHFDRSPDLIRRMYCHLDKIYVEKEFFATAYATLVTETNGAIKAGAIGIRETLLTGPVDFYHWLSWKEETSFGGSTNTAAPLLGLIKYKGAGVPDEMLFDHVVGHEFGHLFDMTAQLNRFDDCRWTEQPDGSWRMEGACTPAAGSWSELSWKGPFEPVADSEFPTRRGLCFYDCNGRFLPPDQAAPLFQQLLGSRFASTYAASSPMEDFAENFAYVLEHRLAPWLGGRGVTEHLVVEAGAQAFDLTRHFLSERIRPKREYIMKWLAGGPLYPGEVHGPQLIDLSEKNKH